MFKSVVLIKKTMLDQAIDVLFQLPKGFKPKYYSPDESWFSRRRINTPKFEVFKSRNELGFFLYGRNSTFFLNMTGNESLEISLFLKGKVEPEEMAAYMKSFSSLGMRFGFMCMEEEYEHCNRVKRKFKGCSYEGWIGKDIDKYVSGLYWLTYFSEELVSSLVIDIDQFEVGNIELSRTDSGYLYQFYDSPKNWKKHRPKLDLMSENVSGIFSKREAVSKLSGIDNIAQYMDVVDCFD